MMLAGVSFPPPPPPSSSSSSPHLRQPTQPLYNPTLFPSSSPIFSNQIHPNSPSPLSQLFCFSQRRCGCLVFAEKRRDRRGGNRNVSVIEAGDFDDTYEEVDFDEEEDDDEEDGGEDVIVPLEKMKAWFKRKPIGFGEGKEYDVSVEEKLLEEIERSRVAQLANLKKLRLAGGVSVPNKMDNAPEVLHSGIRVCINNLPKKKNIHRDLKSAFKEVSGIINISPMVSGNKKTKDPICKGFAYVDFKSLDDANRFIHMFSGQTVTFGKIEKKLKYELMSSRDSRLQESSTNDERKPSKTTNERERFASQSTFIEVVVEGQKTVHADEKDSSLSLQEDDHPEISHKIINGRLTADAETSTASKQDYEVESNMESSPDLSPSKTVEQKKEVKNKSKAKKKTGKAPELSIPGAAKRLKVREKAMLASVYSRYGKKVDFASEGR